MHIIFDLSTHDLHVAGLAFDNVSCELFSDVVYTWQSPLLLRESLVQKQRQQRTQPSLIGFAPQEVLLVTEHGVLNESSLCARMRAKSMLNAKDCTCVA